MVTDSVLLSEIHEQPEVLRRLLAHESAHVAQIVTKIRIYDPRYVFIAARGTSDNAARYAQYLFGVHNHLTVALATPSLFTRYQSPPVLDGALVIGISQSGASPDLVAVVAEGKRQGCPTLAITNVSDSPLARMADDTILLRAGREKSVAATKTYTAQLLALAMLAATIRGRDFYSEISRAPDQVEAALTSNSSDSIHRAAQTLATSNRCVVIARGYNYSTAYELALKAKELAHVAAEPYSSADFLHGPIALIDEGFPVVVVNPSGQVFEEVQAVLVEIKKRGAQTVVISDRAESLALADAPIALPAAVPEWLSPMIAIVPGQLLAYHLSRARDFDPDQPRGIQKITRTV